MGEVTTNRTPPSAVLPGRSNGSPVTRWVVIALVWVLGVLGSLLAFHSVRQESRVRLETQFLQRARDRVQTIERELNAGIVVVQSLAAFIDAGPAVDRERFRAFTAPLLERHRSIHALGYNQRVTAAEREAYEAAARREGDSDYRITEPSEEGIRVAGDRDEYIAVRYIEPRAGNERAIGLDIGAEALRHEALSRARATGQAAMTGRLRLVQETASDAGVLICVPVYTAKGTERDEEIGAFAVGVFRVGEMVESAMTHLDPAGIDIRLIDTTTLPGEPLHFHRSRSRAATAQDQDDQKATTGKGLHETATFEAAGRRWTLVCEPTEEFVAGIATPSSILVLASGLLVTVLIVAALSRVTRLGVQLQREILERERNQLEYRHLVENAPICIHEIGLDGRLTAMNPAGLKMIGARDGADIRGLRYLDCVAEAEQAHMQAMLDRAMSGSATEFEFTGADSMAGQVITTLLMPARDGNGSICKLVGVSQDITDRRRAEAATKANERRLKLLHSIATEVDDSRSIEDAISVIVQRLSECFSQFRVAYSTIDEGGVLTVRESIEPEGMKSVRGLTVDLTIAPAYLEALRRERTVRVENVDEESLLGAVAEVMLDGGTRALLDVPLRHSDELLGVLCFDAPVPHVWSEHEIRTLEEVAGRLAALIWEARTEESRSLAVEALRVSEARQAVILHSAPIVLYVASIDDWSTTWISEQVAEVAGFAPERFIEDPAFWESRVHPSDYGPTMEATEEVITHGHATMEYRWRHADGSYRWIRDHPVLVRDERDQPVEIIGTWIDISEQKQAERRQALMMRELDHRVKNNLASVLALAEQSLATATSLEAFQQSYTGRIRALVRTHEALASGRWEGVDLRQIVLLTLKPYCGGTDDRMQIDGAEVMLSARASTPVCMALHELATNAVKYGALSEPAGVVKVSWTSDAHGNLNLRWVERDGPPVDAAPTPGYGTTLIEGLIAHELNGTVDLRFESAGLVCTMMLPAASLLVDPARLDKQPVIEKAPTS